MQSANVPALNAIVWPSGANAKLSTSTGKSVSCFGVPPLVGMTYSCDVPDFALRKYTLPLAFVTAGELTFHPAGVSWRGFAPGVDRSSIHSDVDALLAA